MKEMTLSTLLAVFEEIFGTGLFWTLVVAAGLVTAAFLFVLVRERRLVGSWLLRAELAAPVGAIAAILFVLTITNSSFSDLGGPIDVIVMILIGLTGAVGLTILAYIMQALVLGQRRQQ